MTGTPAIVEPETLTEMFTPRVPLDAALSGWQSAYGGFILGPTANATYSHGGSMAGYAATSLVKPRDQMSVIVLSNNQGLNTAAIADRLATIGSP